LRAWGIPRASRFKHLHSAMADPARSAFFSRPGTIRPRTLEGRPCSLGEDSAIRVFSLRSRAARLCWRLVRNDGSHAAAGYDSAKISSRDSCRASHRTLRVSNAAPQAWHSGDPRVPRGGRKIPIASFLKRRSSRRHPAPGMNGDEPYLRKKLRARKARFAGRSARRRMK
jgi:hypothetical protein